FPEDRLRGPRAEALQAASVGPDPVNLARASFIGATVQVGGRLERNPDAGAVHSRTLARPAGGRGELLQAGAVRLDPEDLLRAVGVAPSEVGIGCENDEAAVAGDHRGLRHRSRWPRGELPDPGAIR